MNIIQDLANPILYRGVVEDNKDPEKLGRVRVRIFGVHTEKNEFSGEKFEYVSTKDLPWAEVMGGTEFGTVGGVGITSVLRQGTWVWVILENGDVNKPLVIGTIKGKTSKDSKNQYKSGKGFCDPDGVFPFSARGSESDLSRLGRNENLDGDAADVAVEQKVINNNTITTFSTAGTPHSRINASKTVISENDPISGVDATIEEPGSLSGNTKYPDCQVIETQSGHCIELDDTGGNERIRIFHRSGSYIEIRPDGSIIQKSVGDNDYHITTANLNEVIAQNVKRYIVGNIDELIKGYIHRLIEGEVKEHVIGNIQYDSDGNVLWNVKGNFTLMVDGTVKVQAGPEIDMDAGIINLN